MINQLHLVGFKSFLNRVLPLKKLTLLTGMNSSGKSSVIQALLMMEKAANGEKSILLEGHGTIDDIRNRFWDKDIVIHSTNNDGKKFTIEIPKDDSKSIYSIIEQSFLFPEIIYISAHRFGPKTSIPIFNDKFRSDRLGPHGENLFQCIEYFGDQPLDAILKHEKSEGDTLLYNLRGWLSVISPDVEFKYVINKTSDSSYSTFNEHRAMNVGFGLSYALPVITALLIGTLIPNCLVVIENPEAHLHPKGQTEIAKLIALCAKAGAQVIIETHSDHLFDGVRLFVKNSDNKDNFSKEVQFCWFELNEKKNTEVFLPNIDEMGRIDEWPQGFFDQFDINSSKLI